VNRTTPGITYGIIAGLSAALLAGRGLARGATEPDYVDLDLLSRARIIAVAGTATDAPSTGLAAEAATTAEVLARRLAETRRVQVVSAERVASAMAKMELKTVRDLFTRDPRIGLKLEVDKAASLARRSGADAALVPIWDTPPRSAQTAGPAPLRLHVLLVLRGRKQIVWEDGALVKADAAAAAGSEATAAAADQAAKTLAERFAMLWQQAGERG
jgi:hypothetical protein